MSKCSNCGNELGKGDKFCIRCGTVVDTEVVTTSYINTGNVICPVCGAQLNSGEAFCSYCGTNLRAGIYVQDSSNMEMQKEKSHSMAIILVCSILGALLVAVLVALAILIGSNNNDNENNRVPEDIHIETEEKEPETEPEVTTEEITTEETTTEPETTEETTTAPETAAFDSLEYFIDNCSVRYLSIENIATFTKEELRIARNAVYARHGRRFNDSSLQQYFMQFEWYRPVVDSENFREVYLNDYEIANRDLVVEYEKALGYR